MNLAEAKQIADGLIDKVHPYCEVDYAKIAGSIRRGNKSDVKDIELVLVPRWEDQPNTTLLFAPLEPINLLYEWATKVSDIQWIKPGVSEIIPWNIKPDGKYWRGMLLEEIKLDVFLTTINSFGLIFLIRTGHANFSKELVTQQSKGGLLPDEYRISEGAVWKGDNRIETPTEQSVFDILGIPFIPPAERGIKKGIK